MIITKTRFHTIVKPAISIISFYLSYISVYFSSLCILIITTKQSTRYYKPKDKPCSTMFNKRIKLIQATDRNKQEIRESVCISSAMFCPITNVHTNYHPAYNFQPQGCITKVKVGYYDTNKLSMYIQYKSYISI